MKTVKVLYKLVDGAHFFVSGDEASTGLCVAHSNVEKAFDAVTVQLTKLFKLNHDMDVEFESSMSFNAFAAWLKCQQDASATAPSPGVAGIVPFLKAEMAANAA